MRLHAGMILVESAPRLPSTSSTYRSTGSLCDGVHRPASEYSNKHMHAKFCLQTGHVKSIVVLHSGVMSIPERDTFEACR